MPFPRRFGPQTQEDEASMAADQAGQAGAGRYGWGFMVVLIAVTALGPVSMQILMPALPTIRTAFGASTELTQLTVSLGMLAIAAATLIYGPLADSLGRRPVLVGGLTLFLAGSVLAWLAQSLTWLIAARLLQAAGGAAGITLTRTILRDIYGRERAASMLAYVTMAMVVLPMMAPVVGGVLTDHLGWRSIFGFAVVIGAPALAGLILRLPETVPERQPFPNPWSLAVGYWVLLRAPAFRAYALQSGFAMATFFGFAASAPYIVMDIMGRSPTTYGLWFIGVSLSFIAGLYVSAQLTERIGLDRMIALGAGMALVGALILVGVMAAGLWVPLGLFLPALLMGLGNGLAMPNSQTGAVSVIVERAGAGAGLSSFLQMALSAIASQAAGALVKESPVPLALLMATGTALALACFLGFMYQARSRPAPA